MLGFEPDFWDCATFATFALAGAAAILAYIWIAGLPGRIAIPRRHDRHAEAPDAAAKRSDLTTPPARDDGTKA